jgi:hypothetical protein
MYYMSSNPENSYIRNIDNRNLPPRKVVSEELAKKAEEVIIGCLNEQLRGKNIEVRPATPKEDSGHKDEGGKQIDAVLNIAGKAGMCIQITTARDPDVQRKKLMQLKENPFVRLEEMKREETPIPKVVVSINPEEITSFLGDSSFAKHPQIWTKIKSDITNSLLYVLNMTKNEKEKIKAKELLILLADSGNTSH